MTKSNGVTKEEEIQRRGEEDKKKNRKIERKNRGGSPLISDTHLAHLSARGTRGMALLTIRVLRKAASRWPADVYHLALIVGLDEVVRERWVSDNAVVW